MGDLPREGVEEPGPLGLREGNPHAGHEGAVQDHRAHLEPAAGNMTRGFLHKKELYLLQAREE